MVNSAATKLILLKCLQWQSPSEQDMEPASSAGMVLWLRVSGALGMVWIQLCVHLR